MSQVITTHRRTVLLKTVGSGRGPIALLPGHEVMSAEPVSAGATRRPAKFRPASCDKVYAAMAWRRDVLVETDWLAERLGDPGVRVLECTVYLHPADAPGGFRVESGRARWAEGHIPGAGFADLHEDLSDRSSKLRFMMPPAAQFAE